MTFFYTLRHNITSINSTSLSNEIILFSFNRIEFETNQGAYFE